MTSTTGRLFVISGAQAAGKSTVGRALAHALPKAAFIDGDTIGNFVISGKAHMSEPPTVPAVEQLFLRYAGALTVADVYRSAGFDAVIADNIFGTFLDDYLNIAAPEPIHFIMLTPSVDAIYERENARGKKAYGAGYTVEGLVETVEYGTEDVGLWVDNTDAPVSQVVSYILEHTAEAFVDTREFESHDEPGEHTEHTEQESGNDSTPPS